MTKILQIGLLLLGLIISPWAQASDIRCQGQLVSIGDSVDQLLKACGEPQQKSTIMADIHAGNNPQNVIGTTNSERWIYQQTPESFIYTIEIDGGVIRNITSSLDDG